MYMILTRLHSSGPLSHKHGHTMTMFRLEIVSTLTPDGASQQMTTHVPSTDKDIVNSSKKTR